MISDHYQALGVQPHASAAEVRAAYLRLMRASHPDLRPGDAAAAEQARRANAAWEVLGDSARRASYDRLHIPAGGAAIRDVTPTRPGGPPAYSPDGLHYRQAFHRACLRVGGTVFAIGCILLLSLT